MSGKRIEQRIKSALPFAYQGRMQWRFEARAEQTLVHWSLRARVSFSLRFVASTVRGSVEFDYREALDQLASLLEPAEAPRYRIEPLGLQDVPACTYAYRRYEGPIRGLAAARVAAFAELRQTLSATGTAVSGAPLALYLQTNTQRQSTVCLLALPIHPPGHESLSLRELPAQQTYAVRLRGSHDALDLAAWVRTAEDGAAALVELSRTHYDLVLMDIKLGGGSDGVASHDNPNSSRA